MNKTALFFSLIACLAQIVPANAITIKKASSVATKQNDIKQTGASLVPTVMSLVTGFQEISKKQKALTAECIPTSQELDFVNTTFKEWLKTGAATLSDVESALGGIHKCQTASGGYQTSVQIAAATQEDGMICYDYFDESGDKEMVWHEFPRAQKAYYCTDDPSNPSCNEKNKEYVTNMYDIFNLIDFSTEDYTKKEAEMVGKLTAKIENCSYAKLSARKRAMWSEFLVGSIGSLGSSTNTGNIMQVVQGSANSGPMDALKSIGGNLTQFLQ